MIALENILEGLQVLDLKGDIGIRINSICFDSRKVQSGDIYVAQKGVVADGHDFICASVDNGAKVIVCEHFPSEMYSHVVYVRVENSNIALAELSRNYYGNPTKSLRLVGITGTNGKTSIATLLHELFAKLGYKAGLLSTIANYIGTKKYGTTHTTPDVVTLNKLLREMVDAGCEYCFMEVSSHSLVQERVYGLSFEGGVFTNLTHDHLDYHKTFADYLKAKKTFFDRLGKESFVLTNVDDKNGMVMTQNTKAKVYSYAMKRGADYHGKILERHFDNTLLDINGVELWTNFIGDFNVYNLTAVYGASCQLGIDASEVLVGLSSLKPVAGRLDTYVADSGITAVVDYAHTPDALENVLKTLKPLVEGHQLIVVVGAGGNRDKTKRPEMAHIATNWADRVVITSDNPRDEKPKDIIEDMYKGVSKQKESITVCIEDRREAIKTAIMIAQRGDVVLVAGKGHENYQEIAGVKHHFDDKEEIMKILS